MDFFIAGRKAGKTTSLCDWMLMAPEGERRVIVTHSADSRMEVLRRLRERGWKGEDGQVLTIHQPHLLLGRRQKVAIDNLDMVLGTLLGQEIEMVTATGRLANR